MDHTIGEVQSSYNRVAEEYARRIFGELEHKPFDCQLLDRFAARVQKVGPACDLGCGPGHVTRYLHERGVQVIGVDLSPVMVELARRLNPGVEFRQGNMLSLDIDEGAWGGIAAFYSIIHIPRTDVFAALAEMNRVLRPGGLLLLSFHVGDETVHLDEWWGHPVSVDFRFFRSEEMADTLRSGGIRDRGDGGARALSRGGASEPKGLSFCQEAGVNNERELTALLVPAGMKPFALSRWVSYPERKEPPHSGERFQGRERWTQKP